MGEFTVTFHGYNWEGSIDFLHVGWYPIILPDFTDFRSSSSISILWFELVHIFYKRIRKAEFF